MTVNEGFWEMYSDRYGCDVVIQLRRYETFEKMMPSQTQFGDYYSTFETQHETWYSTDVEAYRTMDD